MYISMYKYTQIYMYIYTHAEAYESICIVWFE